MYSLVYDDLSLKCTTVSTKALHFVVVCSYLSIIFNERYLTYTGLNTQPRTKLKDKKYKKRRKYIVVFFYWNHNRKILCEK